ncbi:MAG: hypothetical protein RLZZ385_681 [Pseudomonadota bacterium]
MALNAAEEESLEALKAWWNDNGRNILITIVVVVGAWAGWSLWQSSRLNASYAASDLYEQILDLAITEPGVPVSETDPDRIRVMAAELKSDHGASIYALYGALFAAQQAVNSNDLTVAEQELQWVLDNAPDGLFASTDPALLLTAQLRLGRVILAQGDAQRALALINSVDPGPFEADFAELRGDIYLAMGQTVDARDSYLAARGAGSTSPMLSMKLDELAQ